MSKRAPRKAVAYVDKMVVRQTERVLSDSAGPMKHQLLGRSKYFVTLLDACRGLSNVRFIHCKFEAAEAVLKMIQELEGLFRSKVRHMTLTNRNVFKWVRSDGSGE